MPVYTETGLVISETSLTEPTTSTMASLSKIRDSKSSGTQGRSEAGMLEYRKVLDWPTPKIEHYSGIFCKRKGNHKVDMEVVICSYMIHLQIFFGTATNCNSFLRSP